MRAKWLGAVAALAMTCAGVCRAEASLLSFNISGFLGDNSFVSERINFDTKTSLASVGIDRVYDDRFFPNGTPLREAIRQYGVPFTLTTRPVNDPFDPSSIEVDLSGPSAFVIFYSDQFPKFPFTVVLKEFYAGGGALGDGQSGNLDVNTVFLPVPLPASLPMFGLSLLAIGGLSYSRRARSAS